MDSLNFDNDENRRLEGLEDSFGPLIMEYLSDPTIMEIFLNPDGTLWVEQRDKAMQAIGILSSTEGKNIINMVADFVGKLVTKEDPILDGDLPDGSRFSGRIPPIVKGPVFNIRKHSPKIIPLEEYVTMQIMNQQVVDAIHKAITTRLNILVVGGTSSGKTTLTNSIIREMSVLCPNDRVVILEVSRELKPFTQNTVCMSTTQYVTMQMLVACILQMRPDRIIVGEVLRGEALDLLTAWNTGHPGGICTIHANNAAVGLKRLERQVAMASEVPMPDLIGEAVDLILFIDRRRDEVRRVREALWCHGYNKQTQEYNLETIYDAAA